MCLSSRQLAKLCVVVVALVPSLALGKVQVNAMFSDKMVLQRDMPVPVWGTATPGESVTVKFRSQEKQTVADEKGHWIVRLDALQVGEPGKLTVSGESSVSFDDVLVGEVWVGSGQSNMAGGTSGYAKRDEVLAKLVEESPYPQLRLYRGGWKIADAADINGFSALLFSFGQPLQKELKVPVGLIVGAVGGTPSGRWLSPEMLAADKACQDALKKAGSGSVEARREKYQLALAAWEKAVKDAKAEGKKPPRRPRGPINVGDLYAAKIKPVVPFAIRGVLWDQGESGTAIPEIDQYTLMGGLITGWRKAWGQGDFPFLYVQKTSGGGCAWDSKNDPVTRMANAFSPQPAKPNNDDGGLYRELHIKIMQHPNTAMVSASDLGSGVHPLNKSGYGHRASRVALGFVYGNDLEIYGPIYDSHKVDGSRIVVNFKHVGSGLAFRGGEKLQGFEVAGEDGAWHWADAEIDGDTVVVTSGEVTSPKRVRYGWARNHPWANLFNKDGLPALTFRTAP